MQAVDHHGAAILILLDVSAAFDTVDHTVLLKTLNHHFGVSGKALSWFTSYLQHRQHAVHRTVPAGRAIVQTLNVWWTVF